MERGEIDRIPRIVHLLISIYDRQFSKCALIVEKIRLSLNEKMEISNACMRQALFQCIIDFLTFQVEVTELEADELQLFPFLKERVFQTENVCVFVSLSVCPTNQEAAFLNERGNADLRSETDWG